MIQTGFGFIAFIIFFTATVLVVTGKYPSKIYKVLPPVIIIYFSVMIMFTFGVWEMTPSVSAAKSTFTANLVPVMIFLMCLKCDMRKIVKLGPRLTITFFTATFGIMLGFVVAFAVFNPFFPEGTHLAFTAQAAGWMGGTQNFLALKEAIGVTDELMVNTLLMGNVCYSVLIMFLVAIGSKKDMFNKWTKTNFQPIQDICESLMEPEEKNPRKLTYLDLMFVLGIGLAVSALSQYFSTILPKVWFIDASIWKILIATFAGVFGALTPLGKLKGLDEISNIALYVVLVLTAAGVNLKALIDAPMYILAGFVILGITFIVIAIVAKFLKLDLYTCGIAVIANVGGVASSPIIAASYDKSLVGVAVLMSLLGDIAGTFLAFGLLEVLKIFV